MTDRIPPSNLEAERCLIGCMLLESRWVLDRMTEFCPDPLELFYDPRHQVIVSCIVGLLESKQPADMSALVVKLEDDGKLETIGGYAYLSGCTDTVPSSRNAGYYLETLGACLSRRRLIAACSQVMSNAYAGEMDVQQLLDHAEASIIQAAKKVSRSGDAEAADMQTMVVEAMKYVDEQYQAAQSEQRRLSGFWLDDYGIWLPGNMVVVGARPKIGKTTMALNTIASACSISIPCGMISMEMTRQQLTLRMAASEAGIDYSRVYRKDGMDQHSWHQLGSAYERVAKWPFACDDRCGLNIYQIRTAFRKMHAKHGIKLGVLDYLQLVAGLGKEDRQEEAIARVSNGIKSIAKELGIPIMVVSAINREPEKGVKQDVRASQLRGSGMIEADADAVILMQRLGPDVPAIKDQQPVEFNLTFNRHGRTDRRQMILDLSCLKFREDFPNTN